MASFPDGWLMGDVLYFGRRPDAGGRVSRGARVRLADLRQASEDAQDQRYAGLRAFLEGLGPEEALQIQWMRSGDYREELERYRQVTDSSGATGWCRFCREERYARYRMLGEEGRLQRERVDVWLSVPLPATRGVGRAAQSAFEGSIREAGEGLARRFAAFQAALPGSAVIPMDAVGHLAAWRSFLQPSVDVPASGDAPDGGNLLEETLASDLVWDRGVAAPALRLDGFHHAMIVMRQWPQQTAFGIVHPLLDCGAQNLRVTLSIRTVNTEALVRREEDDIRRLEGQAHHERKPSLLAVAARKRTKVALLQGGAIRPFRALMVVRVWDTTEEGLSRQCAAVKTAISLMAGARHHQADHPAQARNLFLDTLPGWMGGVYRAWDRHADSEFLPDLMPLSASFEGDLEAGECLYEGERGSLVGVTGFPGGTPAHGVLLGMTRAGKSALVIDHLSQTDSLVSFRAVVDDGFSYGAAMRLLGADAIILDPDGTQTLNPFDTGGLPFSRRHLANITGLLLVLTGCGGSPDAPRMRAILADHVLQLQEDAFADWSLRHASEAREVARWSLLIYREFGALQPLEEGFLWLRGLTGAERDERLRRLSAEEVLEHAGTAAGAARIRDLGSAFFDRESAPVLSGLWELLRHDPLPQHDPGMVANLAAALSSWTAGGAHGRLFDGVATLSLEAPRLHIELGRLSKTSSTLKAAALHQILTMLRQRITTMPRALRKEIILEEPARYLDEPGVEEIFEEGYAQLGKYGCRLFPVTQQYAQFARSRIRPVVFGNSSQFWLMRQNERRDLEDLAKDLELPSAAKSAVMRFPRPVEQPEGARFSSVALVSRNADGVTCGVARHVASAAMRRVAESSGAGFDARAAWSSAPDGGLSELLDASAGGGS